MPADLNDKISSLNLGISQDEVRGEVILFEHPKFFGSYLRTVQPPLDRRNRLENDSFNDMCSSVLLVRHYPNEMNPIALGGQLGIREQILRFRNYIPTIYHTDFGEVTLAYGNPEWRGDPIITWDMWPWGRDDSDTPWWDQHPHDPERQFVRVSIPFTLRLPDPLLDYDIFISYWIELWIDDASGALRGEVPIWDVMGSRRSLLGKDS